MLTSMTNAVITINDEGKIITCNKAGLKILKIRSSDIIGKTAEEFELMTQDKVKEILALDVELATRVRETRFSKAAD